MRALLLSDSTSSHLSLCFWHMALLTRSTAQSGAIVIASVYRCISQVRTSAICCGTQSNETYSSTESESDIELARDISVFDVPFKSCQCAYFCSRAPFLLLIGCVSLGLHFLGNGTGVCRARHLSSPLRYRPELSWPPSAYQSAKVETVTAKLLSTTRAWQLSRSYFTGQNLFYSTFIQIETRPTKGHVRLPQLDARPTMSGSRTAKMCAMTPPVYRSNPKLLKCLCHFFVLLLSKSTRAMTGERMAELSSFTRACGSFHFGAGSCHISESLPKVPKA